VTSVLVTGVGGGVGQSILKSLSGTPYRVVAVDGEPLATGLFAVDKAFTVPYAARPEYIDVLADICRRERCELVFPGLDAELIPLSKAHERLRQAGTTAVVSVPEVIEICDDKLATHRFLTDKGFPSPRTTMLTDGAAGELGLPLVLKPKAGGARSRGLHVVRDAAEFAYRLATLDRGNYVAQEYLDGEEYTCGTVSLEGSCRGVIVMRRVLRDGDTYQAFVVRDRKIEEHVRAVADALEPFGPCNFQLRMKRDEPHIFEINARCSGTTYCRTLAGFNEPLMVADFLTKGIEPSFTVREITVLRYWKELVVENDRVQRLMIQGELDGDGRGL